MAIIVTSKNFKTEVEESKIPVVVDFFAEWCGPCKQMGPIVDELSVELFGKFKLVKIDIDNDRDLAIKFNVSSIPTFAFIQDGTMVGKETGAMSKDSLKAKIESILG